MKIAVFWDVTLYNLVHHYQRAEITSDLSPPFKMKTTIFPEILVKIYETTRRQTPQDSHFHSQGRDNVKIHNSEVLYKQFFVRYVLVSFTDCYIPVSHEHVQNINRGLLRE
jgi:hypothetical protein